MEVELRLRIVLVAPPAGVDFGLQSGKGSEYQTIQKQKSKGKDLTFDCTVVVKDNRDDGLPNFLGPLVQGPPTGRFIYIDIGKSAGQADSCWERRIKVPLSGISWEMIEQASADPQAGPYSSTARHGEGWRAKLCDGSSRRGVEMRPIRLMARRPR